jgi:tRNA-binding EMAP/Myf-like protein
MKLKIKEGSENYVCSVVKIEHLYPIEGADKIQRCIVNGNDVVVSKDVKVGDIMLYFVSGTKLNVDYCKYNDLLTDAEMNRNKVKGYISHKQFRVKAIKLKGIISDGMLLPISSLKFNDDVYNLDLKPGDEFTTINEIVLCEKYFIPCRNSNPGGNAPKQPKKINRLVENQFYFHNDTDNLRKNIHKINPDDIIGIHYKKHGTSIVVGNVLVKKNLKWYEKFAKKLGIQVVDTQYDIVYSSRKVIKNQYLNEETGAGYYGEDIWGVVAKEIGHLIPKTWTLYGEVLGFTPGGSPIQGKYDYGCKYGEHKFYVYKISVVNSDGKVIYLTDKQIEEYCEKVGLLYKDTFIYYGSIDNLFESKDFTDWEVLVNENVKDSWKETLLEYLEYKYNEKDCYMCVNKVPEEGIVLRVERTFEYEAYKLKSKRFILMESDAQEKEETNLEDNQDES